MRRIAIGLEKHHQILYEILYQFDDFCKENKIRYYLAYGTLLGAVRHHAIIPWDDDVDVMMERSEYERFQKLIITHPPKGYKAYSIYNTPNYYYPFIKFGKEGTLLIEPFPYVPSEGIGINIDVFPIDGCPSSYKEAQDFTTKCMGTILRNLNDLSSVNFWKSKGKRAKLFSIFNRFTFLKKTRYKVLFKNLYSKYDLKKSVYCSVSQWNWYNGKDVFPVEDFNETEYIQFGSRQLPVPAGYHDILQHCYGDYMTPPEESKRNTTHVNKIYQIVDDN